MTASPALVDNFVSHRPAVSDDEMLFVVQRIAPLRIAAIESGSYDGTLAPQWRGERGHWRDIWTRNDITPAFARVGVRRKGIDHPIYGYASWSAYAQYISVNGITELDPYWLRWAIHELATWAEAAALSIAFPIDPSKVKGGEA